jgi:hypothetical protein
MTPEQKAGQQTEGPHSPERRRFLKNSAIIVARTVGLTIAGAGAVDLARRPDAIVDIALNAKEKSPNATRSEIKQEISNDLSNEAVRALYDTGLMVLGYLGIMHTGELQTKEVRKNNPQPKSPVEIQPEPQK